MAALHDGTVAATQFVGRGSVGAIELAREAVGDVVEIRVVVLGTGILGTVLLCHRHDTARTVPVNVKRCHQLASQFAEHAVGDEEIETLVERYISAFVYRATQFRELELDIVVLWFLSSLMFTWDTDTHTVSRQIKTIVSSRKMHRYRQATLGSRTRQQAFKFLVVVAIECHT